MIRGIGISLSSLGWGALAQEAADFEGEMANLAIVFDLPTSTVTERFKHYWHGKPYSWRQCLHLVYAGADDAIMAIRGA